MIPWPFQTVCIWYPCFLRWLVYFLFVYCGCLRYTTHLGLHGLLLH